MKIDKIEIHNFKKFKDFEFSNIPNQCALVGSNGSGKTTLLQAFSTWAMLCNECLRGMEPMAARDNDEQDYPSVSINRLHFYSVPLAKFSDLWTERKTGDSISILLKTAEWEVGFEITFDKEDSVEARPHKTTNPKSLEKVKGLLTRQDLPIIYVPNSSAILPVEERNESKMHVINALAQGQAGNVFRNLLVNAYQNPDKENVWNELCKIAEELFGYKLSNPSAPAGLKILSGYSHLISKTEISAELDFSVAASGFLQTMTVFASLLQHKESTILVDEPDAHMNLFLQKSIIGHLKKHAGKNSNQLIVVTHSPTVIDLFEPRQTGIIRDGIVSLEQETKKPKKQDEGISDTLSISNAHIAFATQHKKILYVEGHMDERIIHAWAETMEHRVAKFLDKGAWIEENQNPWGKNPKRHFAALKKIVPDMLGFCLQDGDNHERTQKTEMENGLMTFNWNWYSIESYLLNWSALKRYLEQEGVPEAKQNDAMLYLKEEILPLKIFNEPGKDNKGDFLKISKSKALLSGFLETALLPPLDSDATVKIAQTMNQEEIPDEVGELLNTMAKHLQISE